MKAPRLFFVAIITSVTLLSCAGNAGQHGASGDSTNASASSADAASGSGDDMYYEMTTTAKGPQFSIEVHNKMYVSAKGRMRMEMYTSNSMSKPDTRPMVIIGHADKPNESISIDDSAKTYSINRFNESDFATGEKTESTVSKIGEEKVMGFNCVHARIISSKAIGHMNLGTDTLDLWKSKEVPMPALVASLMDKFESKTGNALFDPKVVDQLKQMGCQGFLVRMQIGGKESATKMELTKIEHRSLPDNLFEVPANYKETKDN